MYFLERPFSAHIDNLQCIHDVVQPQEAEDQEDDSLGGETDDLESAVP